MNGEKRSTFVVHMDGQRLAEGEVTEVRFFDGLDDSIFEKPDDKEAAQSVPNRWWFAAAGLGLLLAAAGEISLVRRRRANKNA